MINRRYKTQIINYNDLSFLCTGARDSGRLGDGDGERQPFLAGNSSGALPTVSPVRLTPGWEDSLPNRGVDDFQLRNSTVNLAQPPKDRYANHFLHLYCEAVTTDDLKICG